MRPALSVLLALLLPVAAHAADDALQALQRKVKAAIVAARPSVACILVSRSSQYHKAPYWGVAPEADSGGQLGRFDYLAARKKVPADIRNRKRILAAIDNHDLSDPSAVPESYGSGVVVDAKAGLVLTNAHVVRNATKIYVRLPGKRGSWADIQASDPRSDLAVLKLLDVPADLKALEMGQGGKVKAGQFVVSMANAWSAAFPRNDEPLATHGMISALNRRAPAKGNLSEMERSKITLHHYGTLFQMDARTTPGCSGGAILDLDGKIVGLTTALAGLRSDKPGGFAIPLDASTRRIVEVLKKGEEVEYGFLGVVLQPQARVGSVRLYRVSPGSPAQKAGLYNNDVIVRINGKPVRDNDDLFLLVGMSLAGGVAKVEVSRNNSTRTYSIKLAKFYVPGKVIAAKRPPAKFGLRVDYNSILSQRNAFPLWGKPPPDGVIVREVIPGSPADKAQLQPDKIITHVDGKAVTTPTDYYKEMARTGSAVKLTYLDSRQRSKVMTLRLK